MRRINIENLLLNMVLKNANIKNFERHFFMPLLTMGQINFSLELSKGQLMKPKIVLLKLMTTIFLQLINQ